MTRVTCGLQFEKIETLFKIHLFVTRYGPFEIDLVIQMASFQWNLNSFYITRKILRSFYLNYRVRIKQIRTNYTPIDSPFDALSKVFWVQFHPTKRLAAINF